MKEKVIPIGTSFNRWTVISNSFKKMSGNNMEIYYQCQCVCGKIGFVFKGSLISGHSKSCGCWKAEVAANKERKHGKHKTKVYNSWDGIIQRCTNPKNRAYRNYGGRGIIVCDRWRLFQNFLEDMGEPTAGQEIDRIDVNSFYCKENCRWVTHSQNNNNKRNNHFLIYNGETKTLTEWSRIFCIKWQTLRGRLERGWDLETSLKTRRKR